MQFAPNANVYVTTLIDDIQAIVADVEREKDLYYKQSATEEERRMNKNIERIKDNGKKTEREKTLINFNEKELS